MNAFIKKIPPAIYGRTAQNLGFWIYLFITKGLKTESHLPPGTQWGLTFLNLFFFIVPCTINNFILVPRLLRRGRYLLFLGALWLQTFLSAFVYIFWLKYLMKLIPGIHVFEVSIVGPHLSPDLSLSSVLSECWSPFYIFLLLSVAFTGLWHIRDYRRNEELAREAQEKQREAELNFLRNQVNPHFLFNTLNNLFGLALKKSDKAPEAILKLSTVLRYILYEANAPLVDFEKEKEIMQAYIDIEMLRLPDTSDIQFSIFSSRQGAIPPLLWLPVLENVFKHGTGLAGGDPSIEFRFSIDEKTLTISSRNSSNPARFVAGTPGGIGLSNLRKRLELLYPGRYSFSAGPDADEYFAVNVQIHLKDDAKETSTHR